MCVIDEACQYIPLNVSMAGWCIFKGSSENLVIIVSCGILSKHPRIQSHHKALILFFIVTPGTVLPHHFNDPLGFPNSDMVDMIIDFFVSNLNLRKIIFTKDVYYLQGIVGYSHNRNSINLDFDCTSIGSGQGKDDVDLS